MTVLRITTAILHIDCQAYYVSLIPYKVGYRRTMLRDTRMAFIPQHTNGTHTTAHECTTFITSRRMVHGMKPVLTTSTSCYTCSIKYMDIRVYDNTPIQATADRSTPIRNNTPCINNINFSQYTGMIQLYMIAICTADRSIPIQAEPVSRMYISLQEE